MTGPEFAAIRKSLGLSVIEFGRALGYQGTDNTVAVTVRRYEAPNGRPIPPWIARLAQMYEAHGIPFQWTKGSPNDPHASSSDRRNAARRFDKRSARGAR